MESKAPHRGKLVSGMNSENKISVLLVIIIIIIIILLLRTKKIAITDINTNLLFSGVSEVIPSMIIEADSQFNLAGGVIPNWLL